MNKGSSCTETVDRGACSLKEMCEADRIDAERYRWLRSRQHSDDGGIFIAQKGHSITMCSGEYADYAIDAAMREHTATVEPRS